MAFSIRVPMALLSAWGAWSMFNGERQWTQAVVDKTEDDIEKDLYLHETKETMFDFSPHTTMASWKHWLFSPMRTEMFASPIRQLKQYAELIQQNMVGIGLAALAIIWGFNLDAIPIATRVLHGGYDIVSGTANLGFNMTRVLGKSFFKAMPKLYKMVVPEQLPDDPKVYLFWLAALGIGVHGANTFRKVVTGEDQTERGTAFNFLKGPEHGGH